MISDIIAIAILILLSAFFSASETAFSSANKNRLKALSDNGDRSAGLAFRLAENFDRLLSTILIGNNFVNMAVASVGTVLFMELFGSKGAAIATLFFTLLILFFGEITPKSIAREYPEAFAMRFAWIIQGVEWLLWPFSTLFSCWKKLLGQILETDGSPKISQEELLLMVDEAENDGGIDRDEGTLLRNAIKFTECRAEDIITHRVDIVAVPIDASRSKVAATFAESKYSRLLVYSGSMDNIVGIVVLMDFYCSPDHPGWKLRDVVKPAYFIQKTEKIDDVLKKLQKTRTQLAVVLDEFGGTLGILSMEDIVEELVGEIWDEHDEVVEKFKKLSENTFSVDCTVTMDDFQDYFAVSLDTDEPMLGGWILEQLQKIPQNGDHFSIKNLDIVVSSCNRHRVRRVDVTVLPSNDEE